MSIIRCHGIVKISRRIEDYLGSSTDMIYKFCSPDSYNLENLRAQNLYCRHHGEFNDPFEFWSRVVEGVPTPAEAERFAAAMAAWGFPDVKNAEPHEEYFESLECNQQSFRQLFNHTRITCFGKDKTNLLMWSHYSDGLCGFCIGFDEVALVRNPRLDYFTDVEYLESPPLVDSFVYAIAEDQLDYHLTAIYEQPGGHEEYQKCADEAFELMNKLWRRAFAVKSLEWSYERERRLLIRTEKGDSSPIFHPYPQSAVKELIVGERMSPDYRARLLELFAQHFPEAQVCCAVRSSDNYALEILPHENDRR